MHKIRLILLAFLLLLSLEGSRYRYLVYSLQLSSYALEDLIWLDMINSGQLDDVRIDGFFHVSSWKPRWRDTIAEQIRLLDGDRLYSGLYIVHNDGDSNSNNNNNNYNNKKANLGSLNQQQYLVKENKDMKAFFNDSKNMDSIKSILKKGYIKKVSNVNDKSNFRYRQYNHFPFANSSWMPKRFTSLLSLSSSLNINIAGTSQLQRDEIREFIDKSLKPSIYSEIDRNKIILTENVTLTRDTWFWASNERKREIEAIGQRSEGECATHDRVREHCLKMVQERPGKPSYVYYFHNKGSCCSRGYAEQDATASEGFDYQIGVASWRELMNTFNLEYPSICVRALMKGHISCGVNYVPGGKHYSGNYWWADCNHVAALDPLFNVLDSFVAEYFLLNTSNGPEALHYADNCAYDAFSCEGDLYKSECKKKHYKDRLLSYMYAYTDLDKFPETDSIDDVSWKKLSRNSRLEVCKAISRGHMAKSYDHTSIPDNGSGYTPFRYSDFNGRWNQIFNILKKKVGQK